MYKRKIVYIISVLVFSIVFFISCASTKDKAVYYKDEKNITSEEIQSDTTIQPEENISDDVYIQLSGAVNNPGVYKVSCDKRIYEVIEDAGGLKEEADTSKVNLTLPIEDKMLIYIPNVNENETVLTVEGSSIYDGQSTETQLININTASKEELKELRGIGDSKALAIVQYRQENGNFTCIEDIMNISGIKEGAFNKIKALITV